MRKIAHRRAAFSLEESGLRVWGRSPFNSVGHDIIERIEVS